MNSMVYVDVERMKSNDIRVKVNVFNLESGTVRQVSFDGGDFKRSTVSVAQEILFYMPTQVIFDTVGLGIVFKDSVLDMLGNLTDVEVADNGIVKSKILME